MADDKNKNKGPKGEAQKGGGPPKGGGQPKKEKRARSNPA